MTRIKNYYCLMILILILFSSCKIPFLSKSDDAQLDSVHTAARMSAALEQQSNLTRFSGRAFQVRLKALFSPSINLPTENTFNLETAQNQDAAIAQLQRPVNSLQQVAVKSNVTALCKESAVDDSAIGRFGASANSIYSRDVFFTGEARPSDPALLASMIVARNVWLEPVTQDSVEVQALVTLYNLILASNNATSKDAYRALCEATLLSAQFSMGMPGPRDPLRRMMVEVGGRVPTFAELEAVTNGSKTVAQLLRQLQGDRNSSYYSSVNQWHRDWLGLREIDFPMPGGTQDLRAKERGTNPYNASFSLSGGIVYDAVPVYSDPQNTSIILAKPRAYDHLSIPCDYSKRNQVFDPRTTMILFETKLGSNWFIQGGFVHVDRFTDYQNAVNTALSNAGLNPNPVLSSECKKFSDSGSPNPLLPDHRFLVGGSGYTPGPDYYRCPGRVKDSSSTSAVTLMQNLVAGVDAQNIPTTRIRRFSPSGEQDGMSTVKTWYTSENRYVCNAFDRFQLTCPLRPNIPMYPYYDGVHPEGFITENVPSAGTPGQAILGSNSAWYTTPLAHPAILNMYSCGLPVPAQLQSSTTELAKEAAFPKAYLANDYLGSALGTMNEVINLGEAVSEVGKEADAIIRLKQDVKLEPYRLIDDVIANHRSYKEVFTADYIIGHSEMNLYYHSHGQHLPLYPPGYTVDPNENRSLSAPLNSTPVSGLGGIPAGYFSNSGSGGGGSFRQYFYPGPTPDPSHSLTTTHRPGAGVLAMPAFISPVQGHMRTLSSRYFTRLLCGAPNTFVPNAGEASIHRNHMLDKNNNATNATAAAHLDGKSTCFACHVNLDPLGAALSSNFLYYVGENEATAFDGDMQSTMGIHGVSYLPSRGTGAFLGSEVTGVEGVSRQLVSSEPWAKCVIEKTFGNVFGRSPSIADSKAISTFVQHFKSNFDYNKLVEDMVSSPLYQGAN